MTRIPYFNPYLCEPEEALAGFAEQLNDWFQPLYVTNNVNNVTYELTPSHWIRFELTSTFSSGIASAIVLDPGGSAYSPGQAIEVSDILGTYAGAAGDERGYATVNPTDPDALIHEIIRLGGMGDGGGGAVDNFTVKVSSDDTTPGFLLAKLKDTGTYASGQDMLVIAEETDGGGDENVRLAVDVSAITGFHAAETRMLVISGGSLAFTAVASGVDNFTVAVNGADDAPGFLHAKLNDEATFVSANDPVIYAETVDDDTERLFLDASAIPGWNGAANAQLLGHTSGTTQWKTIKDWLKFLDGYEGGYHQVIYHGPGGDPQWIQLIDETFNSFHNVKLDIVGSDLVSEIEYRPVTGLIVSIGDPVSDSDSVPVEECEEEE